MNKKQLDLIVMAGCIVLAVCLSLRYELPGLAVIIFYLLLPAIYLCIRERKNYKKLTIATLLFGISGIGVLDFIQEINNTWTSLPSRLVFPQKIFGLTPIDYAIFYFVWIFFICAFYEHFLDDEKKQKISNHLAYALVPFVLAFAVVITLFVFNPKFLAMPYAYLVVAFTGMFPAIAYMCFMKPRLIAKTAKLGAFFFVLFLACELTSLKTNLWSFPGQYIGLVTLFGLTFPIEEFIFWICLGAPSVIAYYEFSIDDGK